MGHIGLGRIGYQHLLALLVLVLAGCTRGYVETADLERHNQGPRACQARCAEMGMEMGALVLVSNALPACVCQPPQALHAEAGGGAGATGGHVVIAAAAAQAQQQQRQQQAAAAARR